MENLSASSRRTTVISFYIIVSYFLMPSMSHAEYRVFLLIIEKGAEKREIASTLDPLQYPSYFPLHTGEKISYIQTWRCPGRTGSFKEFCPHPKTPAPPTPINDGKG